MAFVKGQSGNPGGRAKVTVNGMTLTEMARAHTEKALKALVEVVSNKGAPESARISAATALLDRGWGRPAQAVELTGADGGPIQTQNLDVSFLSPEALRELASLPTEEEQSTH